MARKVLIHNISRFVAWAKVVIPFCLLLILAGALTVRYQLAGMRRQLAPLLQREMTGILGRAVRVGAVDVVGFNQVVVRDIAIARGASFTDGVAARVPETTASLDFFSLLLHRGNPASIVRTVEFDRPILAVRRSPVGRWDFQDVVDLLNAHAAEAGVVQARFIVDNGRMTYDDARGFGPGVHPLSEQFVAVNGVVSADHNARYAFTLAGRDADDSMGRIVVTGDYSRQAGVTRVGVKAERIAVKEIATYLPKGWPITFENGTAALRVSALFRSLPHPAPGVELSPAEMTAEIDLSGVGLRLRQMSTPIIAHSGRLRLVHDRKRYPNGSSLEFLDVHAQANAVPVNISGEINDINLFDLSQANPRFALHVAMATDGAQIRRQFKASDWPQRFTLDGPVSVAADITGSPEDLHLDGTLDGVHISYQDAAGAQAALEFHLRPASGTGKVTAPSIRASVKLKDAQIGDAHLSEMTGNVVSHTPWGQLNSDPQFTGDAAAATVQLPWGQARNVQCTVIATHSGITLHHLQSGLFGGEMTGSLSIPFQQAGHPATGVVTAMGRYTGVDIAALMQALHFSNLSGSGSGTFSLEIGDRGAMRLSTNATGRQLEYTSNQTTYHIAAAHAAIQAEGDHRGITFTLPHADALFEYGRFTVTDGRYRWQPGGNAGEGDLQLPLRGTNIPLARFSPDLHGLASLRGVLTGTVQAPALRASVTGNDVALKNQRFAEVQAELALQGPSVHFHQIVARNPGMVFTLPGGNAGFDPRAGIAGQRATLALHGAALNDVLSLFGQRSPWAVDGGVDGTVALQFTDHGTDADGAVSMTAPTIYVPARGAEYPLALDRLGLSFNIAQRTMHIRQLRAERGQTIIIATGTVGSQAGGPVNADITFTGEQANLQDFPRELFNIPVSLTGPATVTGSLNGVLQGTDGQPLLVNVAVASPQVQAEGLPLGKGAVNVTYSFQPSDRELMINSASIENPAFHAASTGRYLLSQRAMQDVSLALSNIDLSKLPDLLKGADGTLPLPELPAGLAGRGGVTLTAAGSDDAPAVTLGLDFHHLALNKVPLPDIHGSLAADNADGHYLLHVNELSATGGDGQGSASLRGTVDAAGMLDLQFQIKAMTAHALSAWSGTLPVNGTADASGAIRGPWQQPAVSADIQVANPEIAGHMLRRLAGHLSLAGGKLALTDGAVQVVNGGTAWVVDGEAPVQWVGALHPQLALDRPIALELTIPRQSLTPYRSLLPKGADVQGTLDGDVRVGGTARVPELTMGRFDLAGAVGLAVKNPQFPNRLSNLDLQVNVTSARGVSQVDVTRFSAMADRQDQGVRPAGFTPGWVAAEGKAAVPAGALLTPMDWQWDMYAKVLNLPLPADTLLVPDASGYLHLSSVNGEPVINGVMLAENVKIKAPRMETKAKPAWGPFHLDPRLSLVLQVGEHVKINKGMFSVPLTPTPLARPDLPALRPGEVPPSLIIDPTEPAYNDNAAMLRPDTGTEAPGTWGVLTGTLGDPQLYARFEVNKNRLAFPLNLIGSVRHARGHVTYTLADGPHVVMGIPDVVTQVAKR